MNKILRGVVKGNTIELDESLDLPDGEVIEVSLRTLPLPGPPTGWRPHGGSSAAGLMAAEWTDEDDRIFEEIYQDRKRTSGRDREIVE